jgi:hypothetical protein
MELTDTLELRPDSPLQKLQLPSLPTKVFVYATGAGCATVQVIITTLVYIDVNIAFIDHRNAKLFPVFFFIISGVGLSPLGTAATSGLVFKPQMIDEGDCGAIGGMKFGRGNRSTWRKPAPAPLCPPQIPHEQTGA